MTQPPRTTPTPAATPVSAIVPLASPMLAAPPALQVALRTHRACAPEHASLVRRAALVDPSVLPRWHQEDRGPRNAHKGLHITAPDGAYAAIPVWNSREHWRSVTVPLAIARHPEILRKYRIAPSRLREAAAAKSGYAQSNGRRCIVRPDTLASTLGITERHVQNINACLRELGLEVVVLRGRMLTWAERMGCFRRGSRQRGLATEVALASPRLFAGHTPSPGFAHGGVVDEFTPHRGPHQNNPPHAHTWLPHGLAAEKTEAAPPPSRPQQTRRRSPAADLARALAREVAQKLPWLASEPPRRLAPALSRFAHARDPWSAQDIADAITTHTIRTAREPITATTIRTRPAALLASILRGLDTQADHPGLAFPTTSHSPTRHDTDPADAYPAPSPLPHACGHPDCDGHGWRETPDGRAQPCPDCDPRHRSNQHPTEPGRPTHAQEPGQGPPGQGPGQLPDLPHPSPGQEPPF